jgi:restriction system protein
MENYWKIMAGRSSAFIEDFVREGIVAVGWSEAGDHTASRSKEELLQRFGQVFSDRTPRQNQVGAGQVWRFLHELRLRDRVVCYDPSTRLYHVGVITGEPKYEPQRIERLPTTREVKWIGVVERDALSLGTRNSLGAIMTLFKLPVAAATDVGHALEGDLESDATVASVAINDDALETAPDPFADIEDQALELVKDRILRLEWDEMQELVAALLRALGYRTIVSPTGADRGRDIIASRDGFGFEPPRIVVEVKHRKGPMGAPEVRAFLGGRHSDDRGLYVSTGGFTREAQYEAERAATVTHLMNLDGVARALIDQYERLDDRGRALLPLTKIFWPA